MVYRFKLLIFLLIVKLLCELALGLAINAYILIKAMYIFQHPDNTHDIILMKAKFCLKIFHNLYKALDVPIFLTCLL